jgi:hypothetical protein
LVRWALLLIVLAGLAPHGRAQEAAPYLVEAAFDSAWAYPGQAVTYTVTAYSDTARDVIFDMPAFEGFWQADARAFGGSATVDGKQYNTAVYQVRLYPQQAGRLELGEAQAEFEETVFSAGAVRLSNRTVLEVMELPPEPDGFSGLVGAVAAEFTAEPAVVGLGEPVTVTLTLRGSANLAQLVRPELSVPDGWRIYDEPGLATSEIDDNLLMQTRIVRWQAIPDRAGRAELSVPPFVTFEPDSGYKTLEIAPVGLEVLPGPNGELSREAQTRTVDSLLVPAAPQGAAEGVPVWAWLIAPLGAVGAIVGRAGLQRWRRSQAEARQRNALKRATARLRQAAKSENGLSQIETIVRDYFADHGWAVENEPEAVSLLIAAEGERYNPQGAEWSAALAKQAAEMLKRIEAANEPL